MKNLYLCNKALDIEKNGIFSRELSDIFFSLWILLFNIFAVFITFTLKVMNNSLADPVTSEISFKGGGGPTKKCPLRFASSNYDCEKREFKQGHMNVV